MKPGKVERYLVEKIKDEGAILLSLVDPDKQPMEKGAKVAQASYEAGADAILVGGSIGAQGLILDKTTKMIREVVDIPIILFPGNIGTITPYADAVWFIYMINSRDIYWISTAQIQGAPVVKRMGLEVIPTAYIVLEPGEAVGWISNANLIPRNRPDLAAAAALAGEYMGAHLVVTDSGSGPPSPAPPELISAVKSQLTVPYIYGGGCKTPEHAREIIKAGADGIQVGTAFEIENGYEAVRKKIEAMVKAIKEGSKEKKRKPKKTRTFLPIIKKPRFLKFLKRKVDRQ
ncbi:MAG: geranylgeranylglyceryl/heptaprenylglyceryl phosphate synthase [Candidatus Micrarchaeota archaeon]|nr:geranylgeranylglyceryl/heptaprenylglyceryl phosphate synthase [Candidatus Micrarchaeota archaeon]